MSPEKAKIFFVEDDAVNFNNSSAFLTRAGHTIVDSAVNLEEALGKIPGLANSEINVAIVDGNLSTSDTSRNDGETIAKEIKTQHPDIIVIGHSTRKPIDAADFNCPKLEGGNKLASLVTEV